MDYALLSAVLYPIKNYCSRQRYRLHKENHAIRSDIFKEDRHSANQQILTQEDLRYVCIIKMEINLPF
jgi:hypothetical protein